MLTEGRELSPLSRFLVAQGVGPQLDADATSPPVDWQSSIRIDPGPPTPINWWNSWTLLACGVTYAIHRRYRRYQPRRLPPLTPLGLKELYISLGVLSTYTWATIVSDRRVLRDRDLLTIYLAGLRAHQSFKEHPENKQVFEEMDKGLREKHPDAFAMLQQLRKTTYHSSDAFGRFIWWQHHMWSDQITWNGWALHIFKAYGEEKTLKPASTDQEQSPTEGDWDIAITAVANGSTDWNSKCTLKVIIPSFSLSIPIAMLARWTGRRLLYLPVNFLQRLLIAAFIWSDNICQYRSLERLTQIRHKHEVALVVRRVFGDFDDDIKRAREAQEWLL